jgi:type IX secretion system PorP/SprF family membrane protein
MEKSMKHIIAIFLISSLIIVSARAQNAQFSQYMFNNIYNNPAYSGVEGYTKLSLFHRSQWAGYSPTSNDPGFAPTTQLVTITSPVMRFNTGFGAFVMNDRVGAQNITQIQTSAAYHLGIKDSKISLGIRAGVITQSVNKDAYRVINEDDPTINESLSTQTRPDFSMGINFQHEDFYIGAAFNHMIEAEFDFGVDNVRSPYPKEILVTGGYTFPISYDISITPSFLVRTPEFSSYTFDISAVAEYQEKIWGGFSFRSQEAVIVMLGYSFFKENTLRLGYSFDYTVVAQAAKSATSHEVMISYRLPAISTSGKKVVRTPRFRQN